jgi:hypothetical protein
LEAVIRFYNTPAVFMIMKNTILSITVMNHILNLRWMVFIALGYYGMLYFLLDDLLFSIDSNLVVASHLFVLVQLSIVVYIHVGYYIKNRKRCFEISADAVFDVKNNREIKSHDIYKIVVYKSYGRMIFPFQGYKYCKVILKDGQEIILTSLLQYDIDDYLKNNLKGVFFEYDFSLFGCFL